MLGKESIVIPEDLWRQKNRLHTGLVGLSCIYYLCFEGVCVCVCALFMRCSRWRRQLMISQTCTLLVWFLFHNSHRDEFCMDSSWNRLPTDLFSRCSWTFVTAVWARTEKNWGVWSIALEQMWQCGWYFFIGETKVLLSQNIWLFDVSLFIVSVVSLLMNENAPCSLWLIIIVSTHFYILFSKQNWNDFHIKTMTQKTWGTHWKNKNM